MFIQRLYLHHFRNHREASFEFSPGLNYIYGANAQGKTNLLEAIYLLITGRSFRTSRHADLICDGESAFFLEAVFVKHGVEQLIRVSYDGKKHIVFHDSTLYPSPSHLLGLLQGILLSPDDNELVKGPPNLRRQFLDLQLAQIDPLYLHHLNRYYRAMKQRNHLLRAKSERTIESWEHEMGHSAAYVVDRRTELIADLNVKSPGLQSLLSVGKESLDLEYKTTLLPHDNHNAGRSSLIEQYQRQRPKEMYLGYTLSGPHKDDIGIAIDGKEARLFASEGQQRCSVAALRLSQWQGLYEQAGDVPLMLIDDIGTGLDARRRLQLFTHLKTLGQVFITSPEPPDEQHLSSQHAICIATAAY